LLGIEEKIMEAKISKAQGEVWDWKESLFEELKNIPKLERLKFIKDKVENKINQINSKHQKAE
jgi:hypothetical protein